MACLRASTAPPDHDVDKDGGDNDDDADDVAVVDGGGMLSAPTAPRNPVKSFSGHFTQRGRNWWMQKWKKVKKSVMMWDRSVVMMVIIVKNNHVNRVPAVETCWEEKIIANPLSKFQLLPRGE